MKRNLFHVVVSVCAAVVFVSAGALAQIQPTITCPSGHGYWDTLSVMVMDNGLNANYHLKGKKQDGSDAYKYTIWKQAENKVDYIKARGGPSSNPPGGFPWDVFLYDQNFVYHWITEVDWSDPHHYKKNNNRRGESTSDYSFPWVARCAAPGGENSTFWVPPPGPNPPYPVYNTNFQIHDDPTPNGCAQTGQSNIGYALFELKPTGTDTIHDHRTTPATDVSVTTMPLQYTYDCQVQGNLAQCHHREVFVFAVDTNTNPVDGLKHSYGWMRWKYYVNNGFPNSENWSTTPDNSAVTDELWPTLAGDGQMNFPCF